MSIKKFIILKKYLEWVNQVSDDIPDKTSFEPQEIVFKVCDIIKEYNHQKAQQKAKIIEGMKMDEYLATKDLTWKDSPMTLKQVHDIARYTNSFGEFKAEIDKCYNGTPETVVDLSEYVLTKKQ